MMEEKCLTFFVLGEKIQEVYYTTWESEDNESWSLAGTEVLDVKHNADRLVVETPVGCFEFTIQPVQPGETITLESKGPSSAYPCILPKQYVSTTVQQFDGEGKDVDLLSIGRH